MKKILLFAAVFGLGFSVQAQLDSTNFLTPDKVARILQDDPAQDPVQEPAACSNLNLSDQQEADIKAALESWHMLAKQEHAAIEKGMEDYMNLLGNSTASVQDADSQTMALKGHFTMLFDAGVDFHKKVYFQILKPEQRNAVLECEKAMMKEMKDRQIKKICGEQ